ncbi:MAG TPA: DUF4440 domain-containing protein [Thermohalobaculum sp.]|nr:DUF4440 domain-containing protein [Thermohalobaculum sp.]
MTRFLMAIALLVLAGCETTEVQGLGGVAATSAQLEDAFSRGDAAGLAKLYTADAILMAPNYPQIKGRRAIEGLWQKFFDAGVTDMDRTTLELDVKETRASEVGKFSLTAPDGTGGRVTATGKYIVLWRQDGDGVWRLHRDIWNNDPAG